MAKKPVRNRFRDLLGDYYMTNRQITKDADERYRKEKEREEKPPWTFREKTMLWVGFVAFIFIIIRYVIF